MSNEKKTAMQQLISELKSSKTILSNLIAMGLCEKYLSIEKQQIVEAYQDGRSDQHSNEPQFYNRNSEYYYSQKYNQ